MTSSELKQRARDALSGNWFIAVIAGFVAALLGGINSGGGSVEFEFSGEEAEGIELEALLAQLGITHEILSVILAALGAFALIMMVYGIVCIIVGSGVSVGYAQFNLDLIDGRSTSVGTLFSCFDRWGKAFVARLLTSLFITLWSLLFVIPGIIASYSYSMVSYILAENPGMSASEAIRESKRLMQGNKWRLFCLDLSFIGWSFVCIFTLGIASLWVLPYTQASRAAFYREISA